MLRLTSILLLTLTASAMSCHRSPVSKPISCCSKNNAAHDAAGSPAASNASAPLPGASIYQLPGNWTDQHNHHLALNQLKGKVQVVAMIFTHCGYACPRLVQDIKRIEDSLPNPVKDRVGFVLVSFDAEKDDPAQLGRYAAQQGLGDHWELLHGDAAQVRDLSMVLNVRYRQTGESNFVHTNVLSILNPSGALVQSIDGLEPQTRLAVNTINQLLANR